MLFVGLNANQYKSTLMTCLPFSPLFDDFRETNMIDVTPKVALTHRY